MPSTRPEDAEALASASGIPRAAMRATIHLRRYMPLYVFGTIWAVMVALLPTVHHNGGNSGTDVQQSASADQGGDVAAANAPAAATDPAAAAAAAGPVGSAAAGAAAKPGQGAAAASGAKTAAAGPGAVRPGGGPVTPPQVGSGTAKSGVQCGPGVRQIAGSAYAAP